MHQGECPSETGGIAELLLEYPAGKLDSEVRMAFEEHLADCAECREAVEAHGAVWNVLDVWEPEQPSLDFNRRLWQRIEETQAEPWYARLAGWRPMLPSAVTALVLVAAALVMQHSVRQNAFDSPYAVAEHAVSLQSDAAGSDVSVTEVDQAVTTLNDLQLLQQLNTATEPQSASRI